MVAALELAEVKRAVLVQASDDDRLALSSLNKSWWEESKQQDVENAWRASCIDMGACSATVERPGDGSAITWKEVRLAHGGRTQLLNLGSAEQDRLEKKHDEHICIHEKPKVLSWAAESWDELAQAVSTLNLMAKRERKRREKSGCVGECKYVAGRFKIEMVQDVHGDVYFGAESPAFKLWREDRVWRAIVGLRTCMPISEPGWQITTPDCLEDYEEEDGEDGGSQEDDEEDSGREFDEFQPTILLDTGRIIREGPFLAPDENGNIDGVQRPTMWDVDDNPTAQTPLLGEEGLIPPHPRLWVHLLWRLREGALQLQEMMRLVQLVSFRVVLRFDRF